MIVDCAVYRGGVRLDLPQPREDVASRVAAATEDNDFVWVGLHDPGSSELDMVAGAFDLHQLAVEDAVTAHQRPKLEQYGDGIFLVLKTLWYVDEIDAVETGEINIFAGPGYVVVVRHGEGAALAQTRKHLEERASVLGHGPSAVVYAVSDRVVDEYESVADALAIDVDEVEESVFSTDRTSDAQRIYTLKRELQECRRAIGPLRQPMSRFVSGTVPGVEVEARTFFRDVYDHVVRVYDHVVSLDDLLSSALSAHLARVSVQQNEDMRRISAWVAIVAVPTMIAGIYGMNFTHMPELHWTFGYPLVVVIMLAACTGLYAVLKRAGWL